MWSSTLTLLDAHSGGKALSHPQKLQLAVYLKTVSISSDKKDPAACEQRRKISKSMVPLLGRLTSLRGTCV